jgi:hypothetical protein
MSRANMGSVTNNSTWIRIGYRIYSLWSTHYNYSEHYSTWSFLNPALGTELHCTDSLTRTNSEDQLA